MLNLKFKRHEHLHIDGAEFIVEARTSNGLVLVGVADGFAKEVTTIDLLDAFESGRLLYRKPGKTIGSEAEEAPLAEKAKAEAQTRLAIIRSLQERMGPAPYNDNRIKECLPEIYQEIGCPTRSLATVRRWLAAFDSKAPLRSLVPNHDRKGPRSRKFDDEAEVYIQDGLQEYVMRPDPLSGAEAWDRVCGRIDRENETRPPEFHLPHPSRATFLRRIGELNDEKRLGAQQGKRAAKQRYGLVRPGPSELGPYSVIEIDHSPVDCQLTFDGDTVIGRPWLIAAVDRYSRMCVGFIVTFEPPTGMTIMLLLRVVILRKANILARYPEIKNIWPCCGLPELVVCDNGFEFHGINLTEALAELGVDVDYCPTRCPEKKGRVERFFGTLNSGLTHSLAGTTLSRFNKDRERDPAEFAAFTQGHFVGFLLRFIVDIYHQRDHGGLAGKIAPIDAWNGAPAHHEINLPTFRRAVDLACLCRKKKSISKQGISLESFWYHSEEARLLRVAAKGKGKWEIRYNELDLGSILVLDPSTRQFIEVPCMSPEAKGMNLWQRRAILDQLGSKAGAARNKDIRRTKLEMNEAAKAILAGPKSSRQIRRKNRAARTLAKPASADSLVATEIGIPTVVTVEAPKIEKLPETSPAPQQVDQLAPVAVVDLDALAAKSGMRVRRSVTR